jgi:hypothetical protein
MSKALEYHLFLHAYFCSIIPKRATERHVDARQAAMDPKTGLGLGLMVPKIIGLDSRLKESNVGCKLALVLSFVELRPQCTTADVKV